MKNHLFICTLLLHITTMPIPLFELFPAIKNAISYINFGKFPTPINKLEKLGSLLNLQHLYIKNDGLCSKNVNFYGGNKVRRLEFILADAIAKKHKSIVTLGCLGSNCALATAVYCNMLNLECDLMFVYQPINENVLKNLLSDFAANASMHYFNSRQERQITVEKLIRQKNSYLIPIGGSTALGCIGFVNAALELKQQIQQNVLPQPDYIFVPIGSGGTVAGLLLGLKVAQLKSKIVAIAIEPEHKFLTIVKNLFQETNQLLHASDDNFKLFEFPSDQLILDFDFAGPDYAVDTQECLQAIELCKSLEGFNLDSTYSGKAMAGLIGYAKSGKLNNKKVLFWNTFFDNQSKIDIDYKLIPKDFYKFFEKI